MDRELDETTAIRPFRRSHETGRRIAGLARTQHGVISLNQLRDCGCSESGVRRLEVSGRLHRVHRGVFAVGHDRLSRKGWWMAAVLRGGPGSALSHRPAGAAWDLRRWAGQPAITVRGPRRPCDGIEIHSSSLRPDEVTVLDGIPITTWPRTIFDLASVLEDVALGRVIAEAESMQLTDRLSLPAILDRHCGERGAGRLRRVLESEHAAAGITRSKLEERFVAFLLDAGLPMPELNASLVVDGRQMEVDCLWREEGVVVELIGLAFHGSRRRVERDTARNRRLLLARLPVVEVTWSQLHDPALRRELETDLRRLLSRGAGTSGRSAA